MSETDEMSVEVMRQLLLDELRKSAHESDRCSRLSFEVTDEDVAVAIRKFRGTR